MRTISALFLAVAALIVLFGTGSVAAVPLGFAAYAPLGFGLTVALLVIASGWVAVRLLPKEGGVANIVEGAAWIVLAGAIALNAALFTTATDKAPAFARASANVIKASAGHAFSLVLGHSDGLPTSAQTTSTTSTTSTTEKAAPTSRSQVDPASERIHAPAKGPRSKYCGSVGGMWHVEKGAQSALPATCRGTDPSCRGAVDPDDLDAAIRAMSDPLARFFACLGGEQGAAGFSKDPLFAPRAAIFRDIGGHLTDGYEEAVRFAAGRIAAEQALLFGATEAPGNAARELEQKVIHAKLGSPDGFFGPLWGFTKSTGENNCAHAEETAQQVPTALMNLRAILKSSGTVLGYDALARGIGDDSISFMSTTDVVDEHLRSEINKTRALLDRADFLKRINTIQIDIGPDFVDVRGQGSLFGLHSRVDRVKSTSSGHAACSAISRAVLRETVEDAHMVHTFDHADPKLTPVPLAW